MQSGGYEVNAMDYVLKPVTYFAFSQKLNKAIERIKKRTSSYLTLPVKDGILRINVEDIYYVESEGHNLIYHTASGEYTASGTMKSAEEQLEPLDFFRGNKCYLINLEHVEGIRDKCAIVKGENLQISRPRMNNFMQALTKYWGDLK